MRATTRMNLENIMLSEKKADTKAHILYKLQNREIYEIEHTLVVAWDWE